MGLDAVVFRNFDGLSKTFGAELFEVDQSTGETSLKPGVSVSLPPDGTVAVRLRLGNIDHTRLLRQKIQQLGEELNPIILRRVLFSGSHSGDTIAMEDLLGLRKEIDVLLTQEDADVKNFAASLQTLADAAERERNPIVFV